MTALDRYQRLESTGLWQPPPESAAPLTGEAPSPHGQTGTPGKPQRREVIVSFGKATLVLSDKGGRALTHWSLAAIDRLNPGLAPALFSPDGGSSETLEIDDPDMIDAIEKVRAAIRRRHPHPGRLRRMLLWGALAVVLALAVFWLPDALIRKTASIVPPAKRAEIGQALLDDIARIAGTPCTSPFGNSALAALSRRLALPGEPLPRIVVVPDGVATSAHLPGGIILLNRALIEEHETPDVPAGFVIAEQLRMQARDPLLELLDTVGLRPTLRLLTTGDLDDATLAGYVESLLTRPQAPVAPLRLLDRFARLGVRITPYAFALDITGETTLGLIEADPFRSRPPDVPVLDDDTWVSLQGICGG